MLVLVVVNTSDAAGVQDRVCASSAAASAAAASPLPSFVRHVSGIS